MHPAEPDQDIRPDRQLAEWWRRLFSWIIDTIIITILVAALWIPVVHAYNHNYRIMIKNPDFDMPRIQAVLTRHVLDVGMLSVLASACLAVAYYWLLTGFWGTTIGKRALGVRVVAAAGLTKVGQKVAFIRAAVFVVGGTVTPFFAFFLFYSFGSSSSFLFYLSLPIFFFADNLLLLGDRQRQCLHDKAADTVVVKGSAIERTPHRAV